MTMMMSMMIMSSTKTAPKLIWISSAATNWVPTAATNWVPTATTNGISTTANRVAATSWVAPVINAAAKLAWIATSTKLGHCCNGHHTNDQYDQKRNLFPIEQNYYAISPFTRAINFKGIISKHSTTALTINFAIFLDFCFFSLDFFTISSKCAQSTAHLILILISVVFSFIYVYEKFVAASNSSSFVRRKAVIAQNCHRHYSMYSSLDALFAKFIISAMTYVFVFYELRMPITEEQEKSKTNCSYHEFLFE